ncbi:MAG: hypothetical protein WCO79_00640 [bacterium]
MAERPKAPESLTTKFNAVNNSEQLCAALDAIPATTTFLITDVPRGQDIAPGDKGAVIKLVQQLFEFADASTMRTDSDITGRTSFLEQLIKESVIEDGEEALSLIKAIQRAMLSEFPEYGDGAVSGQPTSPTPGVPQPTPGEVLVLPAAFEFNDVARDALGALGWPVEMIDRLTPEKAEKILKEQKPYVVLKKVPAAPKVAPTVPPQPTPKARPSAQKPAAPSAPAVLLTPKGQAAADLSRLLPKKPEVVVAAAATSATGAPAAPGIETIATVFDSPEFRAFIAKTPNAQELMLRQDMAEIGLYKKAFEIKDKLATDLYVLANGAIKGDFLLDFENSASNLPKNGKAEFQKYVDAEALERPEQLLNLATQLETRQVLEKNIGTAKAEFERLGGKDLFDKAEREAAEMKQHLERAHESTRRDSLVGYVPHGLHLAYLRLSHWVYERWAGWEGQTEATVKADFEQQRKDFLIKHPEATLTPSERSDLNKITQNEIVKLAGLKEHQKLGERMVEVSEWGVSREKLKGGSVKLGLGSLTSYSPSWWTAHPDIARELDAVNGRLADIRQRKQTIEQAEKNLADITASFETIRTSVYAELPPTIALVRYAQVQIKNTLTSFTADTAVEDLQRIYDYAIFLGENQRQSSDVGKNTGKSAFALMNTAEVRVAENKIHEAIVAQWGRQVLDVFAKTNLNKKGAGAEMEKTIKALLKKEAIGQYRNEDEKIAVVKALLVEAFKKIDPAKGDGQERRLVLMGVMINCGLLKPGEK